MFQFAGHEIVDQRVHDDPVKSPLHPSGLAGPDQLREVPGSSKRIDQQPSGGPFPHGRIRAQHGELGASDLFDSSREEVQLVASRRFSHVPQPHAAFCRQPSQIAVLREEIMKSGIDVQTGVDRLHHVGPEFSWQATAVRRQTDDKVSRRNAARLRVFDCRRHVATDADTGRSTFQDHTGVLPLVTRVDHRCDSITSRPTDQPVSRLSIGCAKRALAKDDCVAIDLGVHEFLPVSRAT